MDRIRPIRTSADHAAFLAEIETLWGAPAGSAEGDRLDVLATLVEAYEQAHFPIDLPDPVSAILFRLEQQGLGRKALEPILGSRQRVSDLMAGRRGLSLAMIRRLHEELAIPLEILVKPIAPSKAA
ncbi:helix-turn-helix domain-containing protein [Oceanibaculum pacificum]|uniref:DNA-binding protein n=1 Tax=Oceanibaculum pacificum TaxID=580166 RepID=A0A154VAJ9_9PROT|nr:DNA-binding protein [Oceanibaculum pacificum]KZC98337.1 DNA-binding protein [Oceanibaculum pacificum]